MKMKGKVLPQMTSRQLRDKVTVVKIKKGCRVKIVHYNVFHIVSAQQRKKNP
jgi:hypothetical protein